MDTAHFAEELAQEFAGARLGDKRRTARVMDSVRCISRDPQKSYPNLFDASGLEGFYRIVNNPFVSMEALIAGHAEEVCARAESYDDVLVLHDTTAFEFDDTVEREGLGWVRQSERKGRWKPKGDVRGFFGHFSLAVSGDGRRHPLGVLSLLALNRPRRRRKQGKKLSGAQYARKQDKESWRWLDGVEISAGHLEGHSSAIHVMDREGDIAWLLGALVEEEHRFVIRGNYNRRLLGGEAELLREELEHAELVLTRTVPLSGRRSSPFPRDRKKHPPRVEREAKLEISWRAVELRIPEYLRRYPDEGIPVNVVLVREVDAPAKQKPVDWLLYTTERVETPEEIARVVDAYRARWLIEEYFKALKTGCMFEERQLGSYDALLVSLALVCPIAWKLLELRFMCREQPDLPATTVLTPAQLILLSKLRPGYKLGPKSTLREALLAVAGLGGHIKSNGEPGWQVLGRGFEKILQAELGWLAAQEHLAQGAPG
jgi:hypothetical protein